MDAEMMARKHWQYYEEGRINNEKELFGMSFDGLPKKTKNLLIAAMGRLIEDITKTNGGA